MMFEIVTTWNMVLGNEPCEEYECEYDRFRVANIAQNNNVLWSLNLLSPLK
jgi:hypothetical protein